MKFSDESGAHTGQNHAASTLTVNFGNDEWPNLNLQIHTHAFKCLCTVKTSLPLLSQLYIPGHLGKLGYLLRYLNVVSEV